MVFLCDIIWPFAVAALILAILKAVSLRSMPNAALYTRLELRT